MSQQSKSTLQSAINTQLADNTSGDISAADVRDNLINMTDSLLFNNESTQTLAGALTVTGGITGSLQGTATTASFVTTAQTASYVLNAVSASYATQALSASWAPNTGGSSFPYTGSALITGSLGITGSLTQHAGNIAMGVADPFGNRNINLFFNGSDEYVTLGAGDNSSKPNRLQLYSSTGVSQLIAANEILLYAPTIVLSGSVLFEKAITSSLQGTATTASYVETAQTASYVENAQTASFITTAQTASYVENAVSASYAATASALLGSVTSASYAATASLSQETIGAGLYGGEIQFKGLNGKNTYDPSFTWNIYNSGLNIGDLDTGGTGGYYLAVGVGSLANGNHSVAFGSGSLSSGVGSFSQGKGVTATGDYSHAEGYGTIASASYQHAQGIYNIASDVTGAFIIGNGSGPSSRSNLMYASGNQVEITGSLIVTGGITGSVYVPYKEYTVLLTYAPTGGVFTVNSLTNTLGTITWNDPTPGVFTATKANAFPNESKVYISPTFVGSGADIYALTGIVSNTNVIEFTITKLSDSTSNSSPFLPLIPITIKVYD